MDQSCKVLKQAHSTCTVLSFHLDEMSPSHLYKLQTSLIRLPPNLSTFIFTSPQCFCNWHRFCNYLFAHNLIKFVLVDEIHLFAPFGNTFRNEFGQLKRSLFDKLSQSTNKVPTLFMTVTCTLPMIEDVECITGYSLQYHHWLLPSMMSHRAVGIDTRYSYHHFSLLKHTISDSLKPTSSRPLV